MHHSTTAPYGQPVFVNERRVDALLAHYATSHRHPANEAIHVLAIPAVMLGIVGLLYALHPWLAGGFVGASLLYYALLQAPLLLAIMAVWSLLMMGAAAALGTRALPVSATLFVAGWVAQFIGHRIEGRKPSFFEDLQYLWIGPLFVVTLALRRLGWRW